MDPKITVEELRNELQLLEDGGVMDLTDDELLVKIRHLHDGFNVSTPCFPSGTAIFRAVKVTQRPSEQSRVSYAPPEFIKENGRLNRAGQPMFYGAFSPFISLIECAWQIGDFFAVSAWLTSRNMLFNHFGYSAETLKEKKAGRDLPFFAKETLIESERNKILREWQARVFTQHVARGKEQLYRLPIALKDFALSDVMQVNPAAPPSFSGIVYPSVAFHLLGDNLAILPSEVDACLDLFEVMLVTLDSIDQVVHKDGKIESSMRMKSYDFARPNTDRKLVWGQKSQIVYPDGVDASQFTPMRLPPE